MKEEIRLLFDERKVIISSQVLEKINYLTKGDSIYSNNKKPISNEIDIKLFYEIIEKIIEKSLITIKYLPVKKYETDYNIDASLIQKYNKLLPEDKRGRYLSYSIEQLDGQKLNELLDIIYRITIEERKYYEIRDLVIAKKDCVENMKYFVDNQTILQFEQEYEVAIHEQNISKMKEMLNKVQEEILKEWESYITNIENMTDENFCFIGHSTSSTKFEGNFQSRYVSTSLFNQDLTATYRLGYGFIFAPKNIVGARSRDMYVRNNAESEEGLLHYSSIPIIDHPKRLIEECLIQKQKNIEEDLPRAVYNEVVIKGFEPIGIFCFTDGSKSFNYNYRLATQLQQSFPNLKIYSFDIMKSAKTADLDEMKLNLINSLQEKLVNHTYKIKIDDLFRYDYFFQKYDNLKKQEQYNENQIEEIFKQNDKLLDVLNNRPENLFSGKYNKEQIKYILGKNVIYNIDYILSGQSRAFSLNNLSILLPYKDKLDSIYNGLGKVVDIVSKYEVTDDMMNEINKMESINFTNISKYLLDKTMISFDNKEKQTKENLTNLQIKYNKLLKAYQERNISKEKYEYYYDIYSNRFFANMIKEDYSNILSDKAKVNRKEDELHVKLNYLMKQINELEERKKIINDSSYENSQEYNECKVSKEEIKLKLENLAKKPILNIIKIKKERKKLKMYEQQEVVIKKEFEENNNSCISDINININELKEQIDFIKSDLLVLDMDKQELEKQMDLIKMKIYKYFKCNSIQEIGESIDKAELYINQHKEDGNGFALNMLKFDLDELSKKILNCQDILNNIQVEKSEITRKI